jgi:ATPase subunit of ABC transporter with duplicated ATPase domains
VAVTHDETFVDAVADRRFEISRAMTEVAG